MSVELATIIANVYYGHQSARIANFNRIRDLIRKRHEDIPLNIPEEKKEDKAYINRYIDKNLEPLLKDIVKKYGNLGEEERCFIEEFTKIAGETKTLEKRCLKLMDNFLSREPIWNWLKRLKGISKVLAINLIRNFGYCEEANTPSSIWKYAGLDVVDGKARSRKRGQKLEYRPRAKVVAWLVGDSFLKQRTPYYREIYDKEKQRLEALEFKPGELHEKYPNNYKVTDTKLAPLHIHRRAMRKMIKRFLIHYLVVARKMKGLPVRPPYVEEKLGHTHIDNPPFTDGLF